MQLKDEVLKKLDNQRSVLIHELMARSNDSNIIHVSRIINQLYMAAWEEGFIKGLEFYGPGKNDDYLQRTLNKLNQEN
jgi:hypothetical protein